MGKLVNMKWISADTCPAWLNAVIAAATAIILLGGLSRMGLKDFSLHPAVWIISVQFSTNLYFGLKKSFDKPNATSAHVPNPLEMFPLRTTPEGHFVVCQEGEVFGQSFEIGTHLNADYVDIAARALRRTLLLQNISRCKVHIVISDISRSPAK